MEECISCGETKRADVELFANEVKIDVEVQVAAQGVALVDLAVCGSVDEGEHGVDVLGIVLITQVNDIRGSDLYAFCVSHALMMMR